MLLKPKTEEFLIFTGMMALLFGAFPAILGQTFVAGAILMMGLFLVSIPVILHNM